MTIDNKLTPSVANIKKHKHICFVEDHYNPLGIIRCLGEQGLKVIVILCSPHPHLVNKCKYINELFTFNTIEEGFLFIIKHYNKESIKPFIYHGSDNITLLLDRHFNELHDHFYFFNGQGNIHPFLQKDYLCKIASECRFKVPQGNITTRNKIPTNLKYPVFTKAITSSNGGNWKAQSFICESESDLNDVFTSINSDSILVQEYIKKKDELSLEGISINEGKEVFIPYYGRYHRLSDKGFGYYLYFMPFEDHELLRKCQDLLQRAKYSGIFSADFLVAEDDSIYFLEINFRNSAWSYACAYGNYNLPFNWAISTLKGHIETPNFTPIKKINAMDEINDLREYVIQKHEISLKHWIKDIINTDVFFTFNKHDIQPFLSEIWNQLKHQFSKRILKNPS